MTVFSPTRTGVRFDSSSYGKLPSQLVTVDPVNPATFYVTASGSDTANSGLSWTQGFATINHAVSALASSSANGGIIEVGSGTFAPPTIDTSAGLHFGVDVRGRGPGRERSVTDSSITTNQAPTIILNQAGAGTDAVTLTGNTDMESHWGRGVVLRNMMIADNGSGRHGINASAMPAFALDNVIVQNCPNGFGIVLDKLWAVDMNRVRVYKCGSVSGATDTSGGGMWVGNANAVNQITLRACQFLGNAGHPIYNGQGQNIECFGCWFEQNPSNAAGAGIKNNLTDGSLGFYGCWFESNGSGNVSHYISFVQSQAVFFGCHFEGNNSMNFAHVLGNSAQARFVGCYFDGHTSASINEFNQPNWASEMCRVNSDPLFVNGSNGNVPSSAAFGTVIRSGSVAKGFATQTLASNGAVTISAGGGDIQRVLLQANATSSTINNPVPGQEMVIEWVQDGTGSRTYAWPANTRFAGNTAPTATTTANRKDVVAFEYDPVAALWTELYRSVNVPVT